MDLAALDPSAGDLTVQSLGFNREIETPLFDRTRLEILVLSEVVSGSNWRWRWDRHDLTI